MFNNWVSTTQIRKTIIVFSENKLVKKKLKNNLTHCILFFMTWIMLHVKKRIQEFT